MNEYLEALRNLPIGECFTSDTLKGIFEYEVTEGSSLSKVLPVGSTFKDIWKNEAVHNAVRGIAEDKFIDVSDSTDTEYAVLALATDCVHPQYNEHEKAFLNTRGRVILAELFNSLGKVLAPDYDNVDKSCDNIVFSEDYFIRGYNFCVKNSDSALFNLYLRREFIKPVTRLELAYITVIGLGIGYSDLYSYADTVNDYVLSTVDSSELLSDYKDGLSMTEYLGGIKDGDFALPAVGVLSMLVLNALNLFKYGTQLNPLQEVSRLELCYYLVKLGEYITNN